MTQKALFLIADITGYTFFLTQSELDHAQDILKSLFDVLVQSIKPPFIISNFQGDAVLSYAPEKAGSNGGSVLDIVEYIYFAFAEALQGMRRNTTCTCQACANIPNLDLKLFLHHGSYMLQQVQDRQELSGPDVILTHRLMKNDVIKKTGIKAYALLTRQLVEAYKMEESVREMTPYDESYQHLGKVECFVYDLAKAWQRESEVRRVLVSKEESVLTNSINLPLPPSLAWEFVNRSEVKALYQEADSVKIIKLPGGRVGPGTTYHCVHGKDNITEQYILDWRPYEYFTLFEQVHIGPMTLDITTSYLLTAEENGSRFEFRMAEPRTTNVIYRVIALILWILVFKNSLAGRISPDLEEKLSSMIESEIQNGRIIWQQGPKIDTSQLVDTRLPNK